MRELSPEMAIKLGQYLDAHGEAALGDLLTFGTEVLGESRKNSQRSFTRFLEDVEDAAPATLVVSVDPSLSANRRGERVSITNVSGGQSAQLALPIPGLRSVI